MTPLPLPRLRNRLAAAVACSLFLCLSAPSLRAGDEVQEQVLDALTARPLGPANMGGRITSLAVVEGHPPVVYLATASGGLWKTLNNGTTWKPVFDREKTVSLGAVAVAPSDPDTVWVGTGEANPRNSVSWGDGVYRSTDGGKTWKHLGLDGTAHIGRIVIHPAKPEVVYVAALGSVWGPSKERGVYKTADGGQTWQQVKFVNEDTGFIDLVMDPTDPEVLYAAAYPCRRDAFDVTNPAVQTGAGGGLYKTTDGGKTWARMTRGLPDRPMGRCGLDVWRKDPRVLYAVIQTDRTRAGIAGQQAKTNANAETGGIFRSEDRGETWTKLNDLCPRPFYFGQVRIDPQDDRRVYVLGVVLHVSSDGGKTFSGEGAPNVHADQHALWIDPRDPAHLALGGDGGLYLSYDRGATWEHLNQLPIGQFYAAAVDSRRPYRVYGGLQDNGTWGGNSANTSPDGITVADWRRILGADGFSCQVDPSDPNTVYAEAQFGALYRINVRTGDSERIRPRAARKEPPYRFNWNSPVLISPHDPHTLYYGGNVVFRSTERGDHWRVISPDLTRGKAGQGSDNAHTITALAESPLEAGLLYAGADDGRLHVTRDGGGTWTDLSDKVPGVPADRWVSRIECSHFAAGTAYLAIDRHRNGDRSPYLFKTTDRGATWQPIAADLPPGGPVRVVREGLRNPHLLFAGTEFGLFVSLDGGGRWRPLHGGLPTVAVHDLVIHPRDRDLVIATHGRGIYVMDVSPLEELTPKVLGSAAHLCDVRPAVSFVYHGTRAWMGAKFYAAPNPPYGAAVWCYLRSAADGPVRLTVLDARGSAVAELKAPREAGLHRVQWNLRAGVGLGPGRAQSPAAPGDYLVRLRVGEAVLEKKVQVVGEE